MKEVNWGIIGLGNIAFKFAKSFKGLKSAKLKGISSNNKERLKKFKGEFFIDEKYIFNNYQSIIECKDIDIIYIALPNSFHKEWIIKCLEKNKKVLVEKPATINSSEIIDINDNYFNSESFFTEGFMYMYHPQIKKIIELINSGNIGNLMQMESTFGQDILTKKSFFGFKRKKSLNKKSRLFNKELGGGAILDLGCYPVSLSNLIASLISNLNYEKIKVINKKKDIGSTGVDINASGEIIYENNFRSVISASFTKNLGKKTKIIGTRGEIVIEDSWHADPAIINVKNKDNQMIKIESYENIFSYEVETISNLIIEKKDINFPVLSIQKIIGNMKILDKWLN